MQTPYATHRTRLQTLLSERHLACPGCGYDLHQLTGDRCPECGLSLDADFVLRHQPRPALAEHLASGSVVFMVLFANAVVASIWLAAMARPGGWNISAVVGNVLWAGIIATGLLANAHARNMRRAMHFPRRSDRPLLNGLCIAAALLTAVHLLFMILSLA